MPTRVVVADSAPPALSLSLLVNRRRVAPTTRVARDGRTDRLVITAASVVGLIGGVYGVGGGAFLAPFLAAPTGCSLQQIAGATLIGTLITSMTGVGAFAVGSWARGDAAVAPNWTCGVLLGFGGLIGGTIGAMLRSRVPERVLRGVLGVTIFGLGVFYLVH